ncbi:MAG: hypothetical protein MJZ34_02795 [Paludibacteraceae bacterium]|nr:hypothetical protein [Paludibacteraceae bacterium]
MQLTQAHALYGTQLISNTLKDAGMLEENKALYIKAEDLEDAIYACKNIEKIQEKIGNIQSQIDALDHKMSDLEADIQNALLVEDQHLSDISVNKNFSVPTAISSVWSKIKPFIEMIKTGYTKVPKTLKIILSGFAVLGATYFITALPGMCKAFLDAEREKKALEQRVAEINTDELLVEKERLLSYLLDLKEADDAKQKQDLVLALPAPEEETTVSDVAVDNDVTEPVTDIPQISFSKQNFSVDGNVLDKLTQYFLSLKPDAKKLGEGVLSYIIIHYVGNMLNTIDSLTTEKAKQLISSPETPEVTEESVELKPLLMRNGDIQNEQQ